jgi:hypothetical protein
MNKKDYRISSRFDALNDIDQRSDESNNADGFEMDEENIEEMEFYSEEGKSDGTMEEMVVKKAAGIG